jgi:Holliday junction resolvasome RuvABC ATP-dependent DNA helicase subunit
VLLYGPPGTGKTLMARACAAKTSACFLKLAATQLVQVIPHLIRFSLSVITHFLLSYDPFMHLGLLDVHR